MKVIAFNGSARKEGNTTILINRVFEELQQQGIDTELVHLAGKPIRGCTACMECFANRDKRCVIKKDAVNEYIEKMMDAQGIILGSPAYFATVTTEMKALIDRVGLVAFANPGLLEQKVGAAVSVARRAGSFSVLDLLNRFLLCFGMYVVGSNYPNMSIGLEIGDVLKDDEGMQTMKVLGGNMAALLKKVHG